MTDYDSSTLADELESLLARVGSDSEVDPLAFTPNSALLQQWLWDHSGSILQALKKQRPPTPTSQRELAAELRRLLAMCESPRWASPDWTIECIFEGDGQNQPIYQIPETLVVATSDGDMMSEAVARLIVFLRNHALDFATALEAQESTPLGSEALAAEVELLRVQCAGLQEENALLRSQFRNEPYADELKGGGSTEPEFPNRTTDGRQVTEPEGSGVGADTLAKAQTGRPTGNLPSGSSVERCKFCKGERVSVPCPDGLVGCLVLHYAPCPICSASAPDLEAKLREGDELQYGSTHTEKKAWMAWAIPTIGSLAASNSDIGRRSDRNIFALQAELDRVTQNRNALDGDVSRLRADLAAHQRQVADGAAVTERLHEELAAAHAAHDRLSAQNRALATAQLELAERESELARLRTELQAAKAESEVTNQLLAEHQRVLDAIPPCPAHGSCIPHALDWIAEKRGGAAQAQPPPERLVIDDKIWHRIQSTQQPPAGEPMRGTRCPNCQTPVGDQ